MRMVVCFGLLTIAGCGNVVVQPTEPIQNENVYSATKQAVWQRLVQAVTEKGFPIQTSDFAGGILATGQVITKGSPTQGSFNKQPRYSLGIKNTGMQSTTVERASLSAIVSGRDGVVRIRINVNVQVSAGARMALSWVRGYSNGKLEAEIFQAIEHK